MLGTHGIAACCPTACGTCGGHGCELRLGGKASCCAIAIQAAARPLWRELTALHASAQQNPQQTFGLLVKLVGKREHKIFADVPADENI